MHSVQKARTSCAVHSQIKGHIQAFYVLDPPLHVVTVTIRNTNQKWQSWILHVHYVYMQVLFSDTEKDASCCSASRLSSSEIFNEIVNILEVVKHN